MSLLEVGPSIVLLHALPSILAAFVYLLLAQFFIFIFRIKKASTKFVIYFIVLYKSVLLLITGAEFSAQTIKMPFNIGFMFYDPFDLIPFGSVGPLKEVANSFPTLQSSLLFTILTIALLIIIALLILRWVALVRFYITTAKQGVQPDRPLSDLLKKLSSKIKIKPPKLVITKTSIGPLGYGILRPKILIPQALVNNLSQDELKVIIGHELAHVKRWDNFWQWITLFCHDLLFFNPFARWAYRLLQLNKELAADQHFLQVMPDKSSLLTKTIQKISAIRDLSPEEKLITVKASFTSPNITDKRVASLKKKGKVKHGLIVRSFNYAGVLLFFWIKVFLPINLGHQALLLLS